MDVCTRVFSKARTTIIIGDNQLATTSLKVAVTWGIVCFILLYRTFPVDAVLWWEVLNQWDIPVWQQIATWASNILPALIPLGCFILLKRKRRRSKPYTIIIPFVAWSMGRFILTVMLWTITFKINHAPPYSESIQTVLVQQMEIMYLTPHTLVSALIIMTCGYAFWRESTA